MKSVTVSFARNLTAKAFEKDVNQRKIIVFLTGIKP